VTPADVNEWFSRDPISSLRWRRGPNEPATTAAESVPVTDKPPPLEDYAALATRNTADFEGCGVDLHNPWHHVG
jgi:hypothetical protein